MNFLGPPRDWIERFGRHFIVTEHTHLEGNNETRDPALAETLRRAGPAEDRNLHRRRLLAARPRQDQGSRAFSPRRIAQQPGQLRNPASSWAAFTTRTTTTRPAPGRSGNWPFAGGASRRPRTRSPTCSSSIKSPSTSARLEEKEGNLARAIQLLELAKKASPHPEALQKQIDELKQKLAAHPSSASPGSR